MNLDFITVFLENRILQNTQKHLKIIYTVIWKCYILKIQKVSLILLNLILKIIEIKKTYCLFNFSKEIQ